MTAMTWDKKQEYSPDGTLVDNDKQHKHSHSHLGAI